MNNSFFTFLFLFFSFISFAQQTSIRGNVYDDETGETIIYANVYLDDETPRTTTDIEGFFSILNLKPGKHELKISFLGYETFEYNFEIKSGQTIYQKILLKTAGVNLQSIDITANKQRRQSETQISKIQVTPKQLKALPSVGGASDLVQYLQVMPGIISTGDQGGQIFIRGGSPVQNKITLDGLTIINPFHFIGSFSVFETEAIQNVDIHTGGFNAEYGGRISAIVNIKTKDGNRKHLAGHVSANPFMAKALLEGPLFKLKDEKNFSGSFLLTGKKSLIDRTSKFLYPYINKKDSSGLPFQFQDLFGKLTLDLGGGSKINAFGFNFQDNYLNPKVTDLSWNNYGGGLNFRIVPGTSNLILDALFGYSAYDTRIVDQSSKERYSTITDFTTNFNFTYFSDTYKFDYGFDVNTVHTDFVFNNFFNQTIREFQNTTNLAAYLKFRKNFKRLLFEPGIRVNYYASLGVIIPEPRLSFKYNFTNKFRIKGSAGKYTQNILSTTNDKDVVNYFIGFISSPEETLYSFVEGKNINDKLQKATHAVLGFEYDLNNRIEFNIETYFKNFEQLAVINRNKRKNTDPNFVVETGKAYGVDFSAKYETPKIYFWLTYSLGFVDRNDGEQIYPPVYDRRHNINFMTNYNFGKDNTWQIAVRWNLGSGFPFTKTQGFYNQMFFEEGVDTDYTKVNPDEIGIIYSGERNGGRLPYYHRLDISMQKIIHFSKSVSAEINASIVNVYNRANIFYLDRINKERVDQLPVLPALGIKFDF